MSDGLMKHAALAECAALDAGKVILSFYRKESSIETKTDGSPLTAADKAAHQAIVKHLSVSKFPVISEEGKVGAADGECYWLVDPLDGTKDFLAANDEFTVNIALIESGHPVLGVVYAPALDELYVGIPGKFAWQVLHGAKTLCEQKPRSSTLRMATSRFHDHADASTFATMNGIAVKVPIGSALKYGRLAMGKIDVYPRLVGTSEWDTAAGQAVLEAAGGCLLNWNTGEPVRYGKANRRNERFIAFRSPYRAEEFKKTHYSEPLP
jgi:3'(2'), 5'-bisphosphate nucleotidase